MESILVVIKPDGMSRKLVGPILMKLSDTGAELLAIRLLRVSRELAEAHYQHIKGQPFYEITIRHLLGEYHPQKKVLAMVYRREGAVKKFRILTGATNPQEADAQSIRGLYGHVTKDGLFENIIHVSSDPKEAEREIKLWFEPADINEEIFPTKDIKLNSISKKVWA
ncbi:MAG: hypothetical protein A2787_06005 [Omnitrophica WOR_2 bacterium RIFCSPHIGHO2_01_FULL_48_9]|nr:MAG: hypothetical protein A3D10_04870 [Omnitrophica WOR_2 bacterium RIFCSPHIGHO2_02_FULL_48_11]OGX30969.1 MAG: hypothetical protein A2787_06005 [Omnitrophica WOR_2 bacterium RIFCSPHIGHO2_01_FULL_48_9]